MSDTDDPPAPRLDVPDGWVATSTTTERVFSMSKVTVTATTVVYENERRPDPDPGEQTAFRRFVFASRLRLAPSAKPSKPLTKLVTSRGKAGFADRLRERGMEEVDERETRRLRVGETEATLVGYDATCTVEGTDFAIDGWVAIWPHEDGDYVVAGGAYPTRILGGDTTDTIDPSRFRDELLSIVRTVR